jgi:uncharacterized protein YnzC (UPF0291/DUF896 family)
LGTIPQKKVEFDFTKSDWIFHVLKLMLVKYGQMSSTHTTYNLLWNQLQEQTQRKKQYLEEYKEQLQYFQKIFVVHEKGKDAEEQAINQILKQKG